MLYQIMALLALSAAVNPVTKSCCSLSISRRYGRLFFRLVSDAFISDHPGQIFRNFRPQIRRPMNFNVPQKRCRRIVRL